ncbi:MAG: hypothetical protein OEV01_05335 [Nitrospira sp.]|nr:hypothetical protein [Nitrospira sp.]MDH4305640.1 hypothetical protein [Nitrospira sp.]MDH5193269.1 hypothetical protein [Nitrospira sp.]
MPPRFNKEPINLIHRIPSQKQIDEARPVPPAYGQVLLQAGALCLNKARELFTHVVRYVGETSARVRKPLALPDWTRERIETGDRFRRPGVAGANVVEEPTPLAAHSLAPHVTILPSPAPVQSKEVDELRACLVGQQDEIARLTSHIQELTSLVSAQQQVLVHLGKELETGEFSAASNGTAAATVKRNRVGRKKSTIGESQAHPQENNRPFPPQEADGPTLNV